MGKFYFAFAWNIIVNLHVCICKNKICIWSDPGVNLPVCKYTPVCICVRMRHLLTPSKICTPEYIYTCIFGACELDLTLKSSKILTFLPTIKLHVNKDFLYFETFKMHTHENRQWLHHICYTITTLNVCFVT